MDTEATSSSQSIHIQLASVKGSLIAIQKKMPQWQLNYYF